VIRAACVAVLLPLQAAADIPPLFSLEGGRFFAECAALFSLLEPVTPDAELSATFKAAQSDLFDRVSQQHGTSFAQSAFDAAVADWSTRAPTLQDNVDLASRLETCRKLPFVFN